MNPTANPYPLPKSAVWRFLSLLFTETPPYRNTETPLPSPLFPRPSVRPTSPTTALTSKANS